MSKEKEYKFKGRVVRNIYDSPDFKIYALDVDKEDYPNIRHNKYGNVSIQGGLQTLDSGIEYEILATEQTSKYGISYSVLNIKRDKPTTAEDMYLFLSEILTPNQAKVLYENYPDIVQRVKENRLDDIDLQKLKGIKEYTFGVIVGKITENFCLADLVIEFQGYLNLSILKKIYNKYASVEKLKEELKKDPYKCLCGIAGIGFKTADSLLLEIEKVSKQNIKEGKPPIMDFEQDLKTSMQRCLSCLAYLLESNESDGHTRMNIADLRKACMNLVPACSNHFVEAMKNPLIYYNKQDMDVALYKTYMIEFNIAKRILANLHNENVWDYDIEKYRNVNGSDLSDEQIQVVSNICKHTISILNGAGGCVDCNTEFFDGTRWKPISEYKDGDMVLQYNKDGSAELKLPEEYHKKECESMWHFSKNGIDQCLSEEHRVVYKTSRGNLNIKPFIEVMKKHNNSGFRGKFYTTFNYMNNGIELSDSIIRLMVAIFADGNFQNKGNHCLINLKKQRKKDRLEFLLKINNISYKKSKSSTEGYHRYWFDAPFNSKHYPSEWYKMSVEQFKIVLDEMKYWDGCIRNNNRLPEFSTKNKNDADFIQFAYSSCGFRSNIYSQYRKETESVEYTVHATKQTEIGLNVDNREGQKRTIIKPYKTEDGYKYCFTMPSSMWIARRNNCIFVTGNTGKSFSTQAVINMLKDHNKSFRLFSPTGKAAKVLSDYTKETATTIHRGLGYVPIDKWSFNVEHKLHCDVVIIDEFSMVDISLMKRVIDAIDFKTTKLLLIGDNAQLPSVSYGNLLHDFMQTKLIPTVTLTKVFRYGEGGLMKVATDVRFCQTYLDKSMKNKMTSFGNNKDYVFVDLPSDLIPKNVVELYKKLMEQGYGIEDVQVLTAKNVGDCGTIVLNNLIQKVANPNYGSSINMRVGKNDTMVTYYEGDMIIQKINNYKAIMVDEYGNEIMNPKDEPETAFIANGENGIVKQICNSYMLINFDGIIVKYFRNDLNMIGLGYSITIHKSQGSSIKVVILCTPQSHTFMLNSNLIYVGLTRMKEKCIHLGTYDSVNQAIRKKANLVRHTFMQQLLTTLTPEQYGLSDCEIIVHENESKLEKKEDIQSVDMYEHKVELPWEEDEELPFT